MVSERIPTHPGALLREDVLPALRMSVSAAARALGVSRQMLHKILSERAPVTPEMAVRLGKFVGDGPDVWIRMQTAHDVAKARVAMAKIVKRIPTVRAA
ncbi:MAG: HigA family addiction module antidote protein [Rhodospirillales bacterium]|nr:HigA family addiction module antidote protein [Rhodospirillales bacterium]